MLPGPSRRNLESYLFDDEVLKALAVSVGKGDMADTLLAKKQNIRDARPDDPADDLKPASGELYMGLIYIARRSLVSSARPDFSLRGGNLS